MIQEIERFRKSGKREDSTVNTKNILFIMSGAFSGLENIIKKRIADQRIGFGASINNRKHQFDILKHIRSEDLIKFGFESEFVGRLPVKSVFEELSEEDLYTILKNPNNPIVLGKKLDFAAYGIQVKFEDAALKKFAKMAFLENTGARGLVSAVEEALLIFENKLPSVDIQRFPVTLSMIENPKAGLERFLESKRDKKWDEIFNRIFGEEKESIKTYIMKNKAHLGKKYKLTLSEKRIDIASEYYCQNIVDIQSTLKRVKLHYDEVKKLELYFFNKQDINIVLEDDAIDYTIEQIVSKVMDFEKFSRKISSDFEYGLKLVKEKTGRNRFFITKEALAEPDKYIANLLKDRYLPLEKKDLQA